jgi:hypothetical protein
VPLQSSIRNGNFLTKGTRFAVPKYLVQWAQFYRSSSQTQAKSDVQGYLRSLQLCFSCLPF